ncbi:hypothetical protein [Paludibaculum fermentans]|uniref:hypothetical protein n=1 Tax=Paludibaculum fermentans TaxID=1473598 RepID=UPI003EBDE85F
MPPSVTPDDRVLVLCLQDTAPLRDLAKAYALVGMGTAEQVQAARRALADLTNVMFVQGNREEIPWQDRWFTLILVDGDPEPTQAMTRVLAEGGRIVSIS